MSGVPIELKSSVEAAPKVKAPAALRTSVGVPAEPSVSICRVPLIVVVLGVAPIWPLSSIPIREIPGARVPVMVTAPDILPLARRVAPLLTVTAPVPVWVTLTSKVPAVTLVAPESVLLPLRVVVPVPVCRTPPVPLMTFPKAMSELRLKLTVTVPPDSAIDAALRVPLLPSKLRFPVVMVIVPVTSRSPRNEVVPPLAAPLLTRFPGMLTALGKVITAVET